MTYRLFIIDDNTGFDKVLGPNDYVYCIGSKLNGISESCIINRSKEINHLSVSLREKYLSYISSFNQIFIDLGLIWSNYLSLYFISDLACRRTELFKTYSIYCHFKIIEELISEYRFKEVYLFGVEQRFFNCFRKTFNSLDAEISAVTRRDKSRINFKTIASHISFFFSALFQVFICKIVMRKKVLYSPKIFLTRYPLHFNTNNLSEEKYQNFFDEKKDRFLTSIICDGFHQKVTMFKFIKYVLDLKKQGDKHLLLDRFLRFRDVLYSFYFGVLTSIKTFKNRSYFTKAGVIDGIHLEEYIKEELYFSLLRIPRLLMYEKSLLKVLKDCKCSCLIYHLFEYSYGKFVTCTLSKYLPSIKLIGFQHGPVSPNKLVCFLSKSEIASEKDLFIHRIPVPDEILAEDDYSKMILSEGNYRNISVMPTVYRLNYLSNLTLKDARYILIATGLHDSIEILQTLENEIKLNKLTKYIVKFHPKAKNIVLPSNLKNQLNIAVSKATIHELLPYASEVIVSYSSVGLEAEYLGIPVRCISISNSINQSPLIDQRFRQLMTRKLSLEGYIYDR